MAFVTRDKTITIKTIVLETIQRIGTLTANEYRGGYTEKRFTGNEWTEVYVPDPRSQVIQQIEFLKSLVIPDFDEQAIEEYEEIMKRQEENYKKNAEKDRDVYTREKLRMMFELFEKINFFFKRKDYFKMKSFEDEIEEEE